MLKKVILVVLFSALVLPVWGQLTEAQKAALESANVINNKEEEKPKINYSKYWTKTLMTKVDLGQTSLTNWAKGGYNTVSMK